jgi:hypothetical protein
MSDQELLIEIEPGDTQGHEALRVTDDEGWLRERLGRDPDATAVVLRAVDDDVEGHATSTTVTLRAFGDDDDTEGHAISVHFPTRDDADAFRRRLLVTGVLAGTIALGAAGGIGLANLGGDEQAAGAAGTAAGMEWSQAERPGAAVAGAAAGTAAGMEWTQAERPGAAIGGAAAGTAAGMEWTQAERPGTAIGGAEEAPDLDTDATGPAPR